MTFGGQRGQSLLKWVHKHCSPWSKVPPCQIWTESNGGQNSPYLPPMSFVPVFYDKINGKSKIKSLWNLKVSSWNVWCLQFTGSRFQVWTSRFVVHSLHIVIYKCWTVLILCFSRTWWKILKLFKKSKVWSKMLTNNTTVVWDWEET